MTPDSLNLWVALPEILLFIAAVVVLLADAFGAARRGWSMQSMAVIAILFPTVATLAQIGTPTQYAFSNMYVADLLAHLLKLCAYLAVAVTLIYSGRYTTDRAMPGGEFNGLALFSLLGAMVLISANNLVTVYVGLELMSLSLYALCALRRDDSTSGEAAIKYFVLGALASGFLLYGMSMIYGATGTLDIGEIGQRFAFGVVNASVFTFGVVFIVAGVAFKFGAVPFHVWLPDVYEGTPTAVTLLVASAPEFAAFAMAIRLLAEGMIGAAADWQQMLTILAVASLVVGNIVAIAQTNLKRMLAYSTISQMGFVLLGLLAGVVDGDASGAAQPYGAALFYIIAYVLTTLGAFGLILMMAREGFESDRIADLRGLNQRRPWLAMVMLIMMFSLAGLPPFIGFYGKLVVLKAVIDAGQTWLAVLAVIFSLIGAFYYIRVVKAMYFDEPADTTLIETGTGSRVTLTLNGALVVGLGIVPGPLLALCIEAMRQALGS